MAAVLSGVKLIEQGDNVLVANRKRKRGFEPATTDLWRMLATRGKVMVDVGAYTGFYSILAALNGAKRTYAYEPNPLAASRISSNVGLNRVSGIDIRIKALSDSNGIAELRGKPSLTSGGSIVSDGPVIAHVPTVRLDDEGVGRIYAIKIDVERAETQVLSGSIETLREYKPHVLVEALSGCAELDEILCPLGYKGRTLDRGMYYYRVPRS